MRTILALTFALLALKANAKDISRGLDIQHVDRDPKLEEYLTSAIENFREQMQKGIEAINMPVLDPLNLKNLNVTLNKNMADMDLKIEEITVDGLSSFNYDRIYPNLERFYLRVVLKLPDVTSLGKYSLTGKLLKIFPLTGKGNFEINITKAEIGGIGQLFFDDNTLQMKKLQMKQLQLNLTWEKMTIYLENFLGGGKFSDILQSLLPFIGKSVFEKFKLDILEKMDEALINAMNLQLEKPEVLEIVKDILSQKDIVPI